MNSKEEFVLVYNTDNKKINLTVDEFSYSLKDIKNKVIELGIKSEFNDKDLFFAENYEYLNNYINNNLYEEFFQVYYNSYLDLDVFIAGLELDINFNQIEEAYVGQYNSDAEFAEEITSELYDLKNIPSYIVIDWQKTSHDLMYDYNEKDSYYFSNNY